MEPKKDVSTAILDQKKAPNKLIVNYHRLRLKKPSMTRTPPSNSAKQRCHNLKFSKEMPFSSKERRENKLY